ncbi:hypothetical protein DEO72_LG2g4623 [Vigna unguiculata]|uniref:Uncharacterized protein n=1 Tax=Vigna unguiculata TaxID=3917 RepID=A0A4D6L6Y8_VIGUN|nr:hypothetical protein DEO72_LG2g4623 [Vigna unguiculata]
MCIRDRAGGASRRFSCRRELRLRGEPVAFAAGGGGGVHRDGMPRSVSALRGCFLQREASDAERFGRGVREARWAREEAL